jgi:hypothetical protein
MPFELIELPKTGQACVAHKPHQRPKPSVTRPFAQKIPESRVIACSRRTIKYTTPSEAICREGALKQASKEYFRHRLILLSVEQASALVDRGEALAIIGW